jgi:uncharacterized protein
MERVFADTGYWIALLNPRDDLHQKASATSRDYTPNQIVTSEMVLTEFLNSFSDRTPPLSCLRPPTVPKAYQIPANIPVFPLTNLI